jgi:hypothetical protein
MMPIADYLTEIEFAAQNVINTIWEERNRLQQLEAEVARLTQLTEDGYERAQFVHDNFGDDPEDVAMAGGMMMETYFGDDKKRFHRDQDRENLANQVVAHRFSVDSLAGSLLEYAKKGIALAHGEPANCPNGRAVGTQDLKTAIWQSRNQSTHWEEAKANGGTFRNAAIKPCFDKLAADFDPKFGDYTQRDIAFDVVEQLEWKDFASFKADMLTLA